LWLELFDKTISSSYSHFIAMTRFLITSFLLCAVLPFVFSQQAFVREKRDHIWMFGYDTAIQTNARNTWLDFNDMPVSTHQRVGTFSIDITNAGMCDIAGNLLFYTNGYVVNDRNHNVMENGTGLSPGDMTDDWLLYGEPLDQGAIALPAPGVGNKYYLIHGRREYLNEPDMYGHTSRMFPLYFSSIQIGENGSGTLLEKNEVLADESTLGLGKITAARHANGRDWWVVVFGYFSNQYHRFLLHPGGITEYPMGSTGEATPSGVGQAVFSPDGTKYVKLNMYLIAGPAYLDIYSFDRCSGLLSDPLQLIYQDSAFHGGVAFSPNSRYLYVSSHRYIYQYDTEAENVEASREVIVYLGEFTPAGFPADFALMQLGPDEKLYVSGYRRKELHIIHNPNAGGLACNFEQDALVFGNFLGRSIPNHPYYGLGSEDGSPCDTLGIDHHPQANFRHAMESSTVNFYDYSRFFPTAWQWTFGDGSSSTERDPVHVYAASGVYEVCLIVSNANAADTLCQFVEVIVTGTEEALAEKVLLKVFPNPAKDYVVLQIPGYLNGNTETLQWVLHDALGREVRRVVLQHPQAQTVVNLENMAPGMYFWKMSAGGQVLESGKLIVVR